jgi:energy-coupling factor transport system ATP-binding protein
MASSDIDIEIKGLSWRFGSPREPKNRKSCQILDVDLTVKRGEYVVVLGASGCGKTTLLSTINGIIPHLSRGWMSGSVRVAGVETRDKAIDDICTTVGTVFQDPETQLFTTQVIDEVAMSLENRGVDPQEIRERVFDALATVGLEGLEERHPSLMSGGQKQKVALAAVLALRPPILLLDDPTSDLDPISTQIFLDTVDEIRQKYGLTVILSEHKLEPSLIRADKIVVMDEGRIVMEGAPKDVMVQIDKLRQYKLRPLQTAEISWELNKLNSSIPVTVETDKLFKALEPIVKGKPAPDIPEIKTELGKLIVEVRELDCVFRNGFQALYSINFDVCAGELVAIIGQNGAGKTTLVSHLIGLLKPKQDSDFYVRINERDTRDITVAERARTVGFLFQNPNHSLFMGKVEEDIAYGPKIIGLTDEEAKPYIEHALKITNTEYLAKKETDELSKGEKQRVAVAGIMAMDPQLLVFDEPTTGQDLVNLKKFTDIMERIYKEEGKSVIMVSHDMELVADYATRLVVISDGQKVADDHPYNIFKQKDVMARAKLDPPETAQLAQKLSKFGFPEHAIQLDRFVEVFKNYYFK